MSQPQPASTLNTTGQLVVMDCPVCGVQYAMPRKLWQECKEEKGKHWFCINGHRLVFCETEMQKLEKKLEHARENLRYAQASKIAAQDQARAAELRRRAAKGQLTKLRNRTAQGKCPDCEREFPDLARHMAEDHQFWGEDVPSGD